MAAADKPPWYPRRGDVYWGQLDKLRPVLILSIDALNRHALDVCVVPLTTMERPGFALRVELLAGEAGLPRKCWAKCDQVYTLEKQLLKLPALGVVNAVTLRRIEEAVGIALGLRTV